MSPKRANPPLTLGVFGSGTTSIKGATALIEDLIEANGGKARIIVPVTEDHWTEGIEAIADLAMENGHTLEVVTDDSTAKFRPVKPFVTKATKQHKSARPGTKIVSLTADAGGKVIVFWDDENDEIYDVIEAAADAGVDALDICAGLEKIELAPDEPAAAAPDIADDLAEAPDEDEEADDDLNAMAEDDIEILADKFGIDPEDYDTWDDVRDAIRSARTDVAGEEDQAVADAPSTQDVDEWEFDTLKSFAQEHGIEVAPRSRTSGYRAAVKGWLAQQPDDDEEGYEAPEDEPLEDDEPGESFDLTGALEATIVPLLVELGQLVGRLGISIDRLTTEVNEGFVTIHRALDEALQKAARGPSEAPGAIKAPPGGTKPPTKAPGPQTKGEEVMAPVLKWADANAISKPTAAKILELWEQRPKGRPTERERKLYALAREIIPEEKRPVGRPKKTS